jgi:hypothetical protein
MAARGFQALYEKRRYYGANATSWAFGDPYWRAEGDMICRIQEGPWKPKQAPPEKCEHCSIMRETFFYILPSMEERISRGGEGRLYADVCSLVPAKAFRLHP